MMRHPVLLLALLAAGAALAAACNGGSPNAQDKGRLAVVVSLPLLADFTKQVGGHRVEVTAVLPSGADPHTFELTPRVVKKLREADVVFINGLGLEASSLKVIENSKGPDAPLVKLAERVAEQDPASVLEGSQEGNEGPATGNPHLWLDVSLAMRYVELIRDSLSAVDPQGTETYRANAVTYLQELESLGMDLKALVAPIPPAGRKLVTSHNAFPYLARYLDFEVVAVVARSPGQEPVPQDLAGLLRRAKETGIPAVFAEPQVEAEGRLLQQLAQDAGLRVCTLYSDSLDDRVRTYAEMMRFDGQELRRCLGGDDG